MSFLEDLIGCKVTITWLDESNWYNYRVLSANQEFNGDTWLLLKGLKSADGARFDGDDFWVRLSDIETIEI